MTTEERLEKLERELAHAKRCNRRLLAILVVVVAGCALAWVCTKGVRTAWAQEGGEKVIRANRFVLEDDQGRTRGQLAMAKGGPSLRLLDENGKPRAEVRVEKDGPELILSDENSKACAKLTVAEGRPGTKAKGKPGLFLFDENGQRRAELGMAWYGSYLYLFDEDIEAVASLMMHKGKPMLNLLDKNEKTGACLGITKDGTDLTLSDEKGNVRAGLRVHKEGPALLLHNENGKLIKSIP